MKVEKKIITAIILTSIVTNSIFTFPITIDALNKICSTTETLRTNEQIQIGLVKKKVNLRTKPNKTNSKVIKTLQVGESVEIVSKTGNYYKIRYNEDKYGYVYYSGYIYIIDTTEEVLEDGIVLKNVNLRSFPTKTNSIIIKLLKAGDNVQIAGKVGNYYRIKYDENKYGYAYATNYINLVDTEEIQKAFVMKNVNLRTKPSKTNSEVIKLLKEGEEVDVVDSIGNYYKIKYEDGKYGYAYYDHLEILDSPEGKNRKALVLKGVNLRAKPSKINSDVIKFLKKGEKVNVVSIAGKYCKIRYEEGKYGYAYYLGYLEIIDDEDENTKPIVGIANHTVNVRTQSNTSTSEIIGLLSEGTKIEVVDEEGSFYRVKYKGEYAYASKTYISIEDTELDKIAELKIIKNTNLMELASDNSNILLPLEIDTKVNLVENIPTKGWYKVEINNQYGYIKEEDASIMSTEKDLNLIEDGNNIYYLNEDGTKFKGGYKVVDGIPYYFDTTTGYTSSKFVVLTERENGKKVTNRYYVDRKGGYLTNTFKTLNTGKRYYFGSDGKAYRGKKTIDGKTYFFNPSYSYMMKGLCSLNGKVYYFNEDTYEMKKNTTKTVGGKVKLYIGSYGTVYKKEKLDTSKLAKIIYNGFDKMGTRYSYDLSEGLDCSGFVSTVLRESGMSVFPTDHPSSQDQALYCEKKNLTVDVNSLKVGDLIFYNNDNCEDKVNNGYCERELSNGMHIHHVSIYIGNGKVIESSDSTYKSIENDGVRVSDLDLSKDKNYYVFMAARIL